MKARVVVVIVVLSVLAVALVTPEQSVLRVAAAIALGTLAAIAWQSWETRRAAQAAEQGSASTRDALAEAEKGRLDQQATQTWVEVDRHPWPPRALSTVGGWPQPFPANTTFALPGAAQQLVLLQAEGSIRNEGNRTVRAVFSGWFRFHDLDPAPALAPEQEWSQLESARVSLLAPGQTIRFRIEDALPVAHWVANAEAAKLGEVDPYVIRAEIILDDSLDNGVTDNWILELGGQPLEAVLGNASGWAIVKVGMTPGQSYPTYGQVLPRQRRYWRSRSEKIQL